MTHAHPSSTLFPYTTLFRSNGFKGMGREPAIVADLIDIPHEQAESTRIDPQDRKSTRLNSSHRCSSYAVFCLKKKSSSTERSNSRKSSSTSFPPSQNFISLQ